MQDVSAVGQRADLVQGAGPTKHSGGDAVAHGNNHAAVLDASDLSGPDKVTRRVADEGTANSF